MRDPVLSMRGLDAHYGDFQALYGVDMDVAEGEVLAIIGANGAGKTTLMRSVTGLLANGAGQVGYRGQDISGLRADQVAGLGILPGKQRAKEKRRRPSHSQSRFSCLLRNQKWLEFCRPLHTTSNRFPTLTLCKYGWPYHKDT